MSFWSFLDTFVTTALIQIPFITDQDFETATAYQSISESSLHIRITRGWHLTIGSWLLWNGQNQQFWSDCFEESRPLSQIAQVILK